MLESQLGCLPRIHILLRQAYLPQEAAPEPKHVRGPAGGGQHLGKHGIIGRHVPHRELCTHAAAFDVISALETVHTYDPFTQKAYPTDGQLTSTGPSLVLNLTFDAYDASYVMTPDMTC